MPNSRNLRPLILAALFLGLVQTHSLFAQCEQSKFTPPGASDGEYVGLSLSLSGNFMAVGTGSTSAAYVLERSGMSWLEEARIIPADFEAGMLFGQEVSLSSDRLLIGAQGDDVAGSDSGSAYIFHRVGGIWTQEAKLQPSDPVSEAHFGATVALSGDVAVVGASTPSRAYVYRRSGSVWNQEAILFGSPSVNFKNAVLAIEGTTLLVATADTPNSMLHFYRYESGVWELKTTTSAPWILDLAVSGDTAIAGIPIFYNEQTMRHEGKVTTYRRTGELWAEQSVLQPQNLEPDSRFGNEVTISGNSILVGSGLAKKVGGPCIERVGAAHLFQWNGSNWLEQAQFVHSDSNTDDGFGVGLAIGPNYYAIGAPGEDSPGQDRGTICNFAAQAINDCNQNKISDLCDITINVSKDCNGNARPDNCDIALSESDDCTLDGIPDECDPDCNSNGVSDTCDIATGIPDCNKNRIPDSCDAAFACAVRDACLIKLFNGPGPSFGDSVAIDGNWAISTSRYWYDDDGWNPSIPGSAYLYRRSGADWVFHADITPPNPSLAYAIDSAISGDRLAVVAENTYIRRRNGNNWTVEAILPPGLVVLDQDALLLNHELYRRSGLNWNLEATLLPGDLTFSAGDIDGDQAIIAWTTYDATPETPDSGAVMIYRKSGGSWAEEALLRPSDPVAYGHFGWPIAIDGDYAVVAEKIDPPGCAPATRPGGLYIYKRSGVDWNLMQMLDYGVVGGPGNDEYSIDINGNQIIVGSASPDSPMVFELDSTETYWVPNTDIPAATQNIAKGRQVALSGPWAIVGNTDQKRAYFVAVDDDCNENGTADMCDIKSGYSADADDDLKPDSCPCSWGRPSMKDGPMAQPSFGCSGPGYAPKNRYVTFVAPETPAGATGIALRVTMQIPGPYPCAGVPDFTASDGAQMWIGPEHLAGGMPTGVHRMQPSPYFFDWGSLDDMVVKISDCNIVPCAAYAIEAISDLDYPSGPYSPGLTLTTTPVWADIVAQGSSTLPNGIVDFSDISVLVDRFKVLPTAPPGTWCDLASASPTQGSKLNIDFSDISAGVDAFRGLPYPFAGPSAPSACP